MKYLFDDCQLSWFKKITIFITWSLNFSFSCLTCSLSLWMTQREMEPSLCRPRDYWLYIWQCEVCWGHGWWLGGELESGWVQGDQPPLAIMQILSPGSPPTTQHTSLQHHWPKSTFILCNGWIDITEDYLMIVVNGLQDSSLNKWKF